MFSRDEVAGAMRQGGATPDDIKQWGEWPLAPEALGRLETRRPGFTSSFLDELERTQGRRHAGRARALRRWFVARLCRLVFATLLVGAAIVVVVRLAAGGAGIVHMVRALSFLVCCLFVWVRLLPRPDPE